MQHSIQASRSPSVADDSTASSDTGPPCWMPAYQSGVGMCGREKRKWFVRGMPVGNTTRKTTRIVTTVSARYR
jgi:hypothetical protein